MTESGKDAYLTTIYDFITDIFVLCPVCSKQALVKTPGYSSKKDFEIEVKLVCNHCGHNKLLKEKPKPDIINNPDKPLVKGRTYIIASTIDPFFHLPLWLITDSCNNTLWAYNYEHLNFLKRHIEARLRERNRVDTSHSSIGSKLPKWMTSKKNREQVLKCIEYLQNK